MRNLTLVGRVLTLVMVLVGCGSASSRDVRADVEPCQVSGEPAICLNGPVPALEVKIVDGELVVSSVIEGSEPTCETRKSADGSSRATCRFGQSEVLTLWVSDFGAFQSAIVQHGYSSVAGLCVVTEDILGPNFSLSLQYGSVGVAPSEGEACSGG